MRVTLIAPEQQHWFWQMTTSFMQEAAKDLNIELEVLDASRNFMREVQLAREVVARETPPDYLMIGNEKGSAAQLIDIANKAGVNVFLFSNGFVRREDIEKMKTPRAKYKHWIGQLIPDNYTAGYLMGKSLIEEGAKLPSSEENLSMFAVAGAFNTHASNERIKGLKAAVNAHGINVDLKQVFPADWNRTIAKNITTQALIRYPSARLIWAVNDTSAFGAIEAASQSNRMPGIDTLFASCGWHPQSTDFVKQGKLSTSVGGHFMDGAWALIMLYDYHHGIDFISDPIQSKMYTMTSVNVGAIEAILIKENWSKINFKQFTKYHNKALTKYNTDLSAVIKNMTE